MKLKTLAQLLPLAALPLLAASCKGSEPKTPAQNDAPLKVMSFNIRYVTSADVGDNAWTARTEPCAKMIKDENPDIIGLQEFHVEHRTDLLPLIDSTYNIYGAWMDTEDAVSGSTSILFRKDRFKVKDQGFFWLSETPDEPSRPTWNATDTQYRTASWVILSDKTSGREFMVCDTHLPYKTADNEARAACAQLILERIKGIADEKATVFLTGDMNASCHLTDGRRASIAPFLNYFFDAKRKVRDLTPTVTSFNSFGSSAAKATWDIDHIYYRNAKGIDYKVVNYAGYGVPYVSDHYPIVLNCTY